MNKHCICNLRNIYKTIISFENEMEKTFGLNINELMLLCLLSDQDNLSSGEIADHLELTPSNTSKVIASLDKQKAIQRHICKQDKRCMRFSLTTKGKELLSLVNCEKIQLPESLAALIS